MAIGDVYRVVFQQRLAEQLMINVLHFRSKKLTDSAQDVAETFDAFVTASWKNIQSSAVRYERIKVTRADGSSDEVYEMVPTTQVAAASGDAYPAQISVVFALRSNTTSRRKNGRFFVGGVLAVPVLQSTQRMSPSALTTYTTFATAMLDAFHPSLLATGYHIGTWSKPLLGTQPGGPREGVFTPAELIRVDGFYRTQRRRVVGVGA